MVPRGGGLLAMIIRRLDLGGEEGYFTHAQRLAPRSFLTQSRSSRPPGGMISTFHRPRH